MSMEERATELLSMPDCRLFAHGGCHVFAIVLSEISQLPLLWVTENGGNHDHIGCAAADGKLSDVFGTFSLSEYVRAEILDDRKIEFRPSTLAEIERRFVTAHGPGYYAHPDFVGAARLRAELWIKRYIDYFDGTKPTPIPGLDRVERARDVEYDGLVANWESAETPHLLQRKTAGIASLPKVVLDSENYE